MEKSLSPSAQKVQDALAKFGLPLTVVELPQTTRSAKEAAQAIGCTVEQIAKSLIFKGSRSGNPILVIASGTNRVDEKKLTDLIGEPVEKPDAEYVLQRTGFVIGGVAPVGHSNWLPTYIDADLLNLAEIWAAAGNPNAVFQLTPQDLLKITSGQVADIKS